MQKPIDRYPHYSTFHGTDFMAVLEKKTYERKDWTKKEN